MTTLTDSIRGCLLGGAIGDAMGAFCEGKPAGAGPPGDGRPIYITDDTQLTLATCEAIVSKQQLDPASVAESFESWHRSRRLRGVGSSTLQALTGLSQGGHWALVGARGDRAAGNGAAMRIAPAAYWVDPTRPENLELIRDLCRITHHHDEAFAAALAVAVAVHLAATGAWTTGTRLADQVARFLPDSNTRDVLRALAPLPAAVPLVEIASLAGTSGYAAQSVPLALAAAERLVAGDFDQELAALISLGGDTDTIASITGQIAGARVGRNALPQHRLDTLAELDLILPIVENYAHTLSGRRQQAT